MSTQPDTKIVIVVRDDLPVWQKLNLTAFLSSGVANTAPESVGEAYQDADGTKYTPMFSQPVLVFAADAYELSRTLDRALSAASSRRSTPRNCSRRATTSTTAQQSPLSPGPI